MSLWVLMTGQSVVRTHADSSNFPPKKKNKKRAIRGALKETIAAHMPL